MKQNGGVPCARKEGLVIQELPDEVLIYDRERDKAHCLNQTAALVWKYCDGKTTVANIARKLARELDSAEIDEKVIWYALDQLGKDHLLEENVITPAMFGGMNRRQMVRTLGLTAIVAVPLVTSIIAPTPAQAATCLPTGSACTAGPQCCSGVCTGGTTCA